MTQAIFGLIGVIVGSILSWLQNYWARRLTEDKNARYLAIRVICVLDKFVEDCADVVKDDGLSYGQRDSEGSLRPQVKSPGPPVFPSDVDWKSINQDLMYELLSIPSEVEAGDRMINATEDISTPPDFEDWFEERRFYYSQFGLVACVLSDKLAKKYGVKKKIYNGWEPAEDLKRELEAVTKRRQKRIDGYRDFVRTHLK